MFRIIAVVFSALFLFHAPAYAEMHAHEGHQGGYHEMKEKIKNMSEAERKAFFEEKRAKWQAMSKAEKLAEIEKRRGERIRMMEEKWKSMSDDEKIAHVEQKMKRWSEGGGKCDSRGHREGGRQGAGGEHTAHPAGRQ